MTDRVTLYRVRRPDGTVHAVFSNQERLDSAALNYLIENDGYTIDAVEYATVNPEREAAIQEMRDVLEVEYACANVSPAEDPEALLIWIDWIGRKATVALAAFDKAEGAK